MVFLIYFLWYVKTFGWYILLGIIAILWLAFLLYQNEIAEWWEDNTEYTFQVPAWMDFTEEIEDTFQNKKNPANKKDLWS